MMKFKTLLITLFSIVGILLVLNVRKRLGGFRRMMKYSVSPISKDWKEGTSNLIITYHVGNIVGFCSNMNNAMNALILAKETGSSFLMIVYTGWNYVSLVEFIDSPYIVEGKLDPYLKLQNSSIEIPTKFEKFPDFVANLKTKVNLPIGPFENALWVPFRDLTNNLEKYYRDIKVLYEKKRKLVLQEFWILKPKYLGFISTLINDHPLVNGESGRALIAIHIRRGDKITWGEMSEIAMSSYTNQLESVIRSQKLQKITVFIMSDESGTMKIAKKMINQMGERFEMDLLALTLLDLYAFVDEFAMSNPSYSGYRPKIIDLVSEDMNGGHQQLDFHNKDEEVRMKNTRDLVLSMSFAGFSDFFIGSFSSNVGRFIALLREDKSFDSNISLDEPWSHI